jgi:hypothetical protein
MQKIYNKTMYLCNKIKNPLESHQVSHPLKHKERERPPTLQHLNSQTRDEQLATVAFGAGARVALGGSFR